MQKKRYLRLFALLTLSSLALTVAGGCASNAAVENTTASVSAEETDEHTEETEDEMTEETEAEEEAVSDGTGEEASEEPAAAALSSDDTLYSTQILSVTPGASDAARLELYGEAVAMSAPDAVLKECETDPSNPDYYKDLMEAEVYNYKYIFALPFAFAANDDFYALESAGRSVKRLDPENLSDENKEKIEELSEMRKSIVQTASVTKNVYPIWGDSMATSDETGELVWDLNCNDNDDFEPFLIAYRLPDQSQVKGNIIVVAGGGYESRANYTEGYPIAEAFYEMGYNAFVLQRRVAPYSAQDAWLDLTRSIRYLRHNADDLGIDGLDCIMATGYSGGSATVIGSMTNLYGDVQPTIYDSDYTPDAVDAENADLDAAFLIYGFASQIVDGETRPGISTENTNLPPCFVAVGGDDSMAPQMPPFVESLSEQTTVEYHQFAGVGHGFGVGVEDNTSSWWLPMANCFIDYAKIIAAEHTVDGVTFPGYCTKYQKVTAEVREGTVSDAYVGISESGRQFYMGIINGQGEGSSVLEVSGTVESGGLNVTYETYRGYLESSARIFWEEVDDSAWIPFEN